MLMETQVKTPSMQDKMHQQLLDLVGKLRVQEQIQCQTQDTAALHLAMAKLEFRGSCRGAT